MINQVRLKVFGFGLMMFSCLIAPAQAEFKRAGNYYALQIRGEVKTPYVFTEVSSFHEGKAWVNTGGLYGFIDTLGEQVCDYLYADVDKYENGFAPVSRDTQDGQYGFVNAAGQEVCPLKYSRVKGFYNGFAPVQIDSNWTLLDTNGVEVFEAHYDYPPIVISHNFIIVAQSGKWGVVNSLGENQYPLKFDLITKDGVAYIQNRKVYLGLL